MAFKTMRKPGLYIHVPFCRSKCPYCAFFSIASASLIPRWLNAFRKEIKHYKGHFDEFDSLYLGGGTPSFLDIKDLAGMMEHLFNHFDFARDTEITIEANPCDLTAKKIMSLRDLGFNRISLGVQSFEDNELLFLGRRHTARQSKTALMDLRSAGFENIGLDLIYGFEGQTLEGWVRTLKQAVEFRPEHLSCYQLTIEKKTPFGRLYENGMLTPPGEENERIFFMATSNFLKDTGYIHYEISNFARKVNLVSRHNSKYWQHVPYLGLGPSAHSFQNPTRRWNIRSVKKYCEMLEGGKAPIEGYENLTEEQMRLEKVSLGLRTNQGIDLKKIPGNPELNDLLLRLRDSGLIKITNNRILPTRKGFLVADQLPLYLLDIAEHS
jgi:oxygen-independent coproporphyrinogen-3 oxidase